MKRGGVGGLVEPDLAAAGERLTPAAWAMKDLEIARLPRAPQLLEVRHEPGDVVRPRGAHQRLLGDPSRPYLASGSGRSWKRTTLLVVPLPPST